MTVDIRTIATWTYEHLLFASVSTFICYVVLVRNLRFRRLQKLEKKFARYVNNPHGMNYREAHEITKLHMIDEQPYLTALSTQWALIRTYAVASRTRLLASTRTLSSNLNVGKKAEDTAQLLMEILLGDLDSKRSMAAISKINWLHAQYRHRVKNDDMIFALSEFTNEPIKFINQWGWRPLSNMEMVARFVLWREIGLRMGIEDIPATLEELQVWLAEFESREMAYADSNAACANATLRLYLRGMPRFLHKPIRGLARALMEPWVNQALGWRPAPRWAVCAVDMTFRFRAWCISHLALPRVTLVQLPKFASDGRIYRKKYLFEPWYMQQDAWTRFRTYFGSWGRMHAGHEFGSRGYVPEELGPIHYIEKSREAVLKQAAAMETHVAKVKGGLCPFDYEGELKWVKNGQQSAESIERHEPRSIGEQYSN